MLATRQFHQPSAYRNSRTPESVFLSSRTRQPGRCLSLLVPLRPRVQPGLQRHLSTSVNAWSTNASASSAWTGVFEALDGAMRFAKDELLQRKVPLLSKEDMEKVLYRETIVNILRNRGCTPASAVKELSDLDYVASLIVEAHVRCTVQRYESAMKDASAEPSASTARAQATIFESNNGSFKSSKASTERSDPQDKGKQKEGHQQRVRKYASFLMSVVQKQPAMLVPEAYPHLPLEIRNLEAMTWMLSNETFCKQLEASCNHQADTELKMMSPQQLAQHDTQMDLLPLMDSLGSYGIGHSMEHSFRHIFTDPEVAAAYRKPSVMQAIEDITANPQSVAKYRSDADVMKVVDKLSELMPEGQKYA